MCAGMASYVLPYQSDRSSGSTAIPMRHHGRGMTLMVTGRGRFQGLGSLEQDLASSMRMCCSPLTLQAQGGRAHSVVKGGWTQPWLAGLQHVTPIAWGPSLSTEASLSWVSRGRNFPGCLKLEELRKRPWLWLVFHKLGAPPLRCKYLCFVSCIMCPSPRTFTSLDPHAFCQTGSHLPSFPSAVA